MDAHASGKVTQKLVIFRFGTRDSDAERGIWEGFFHDADELDDILGHRKEKGEKNPKKPGYPNERTSHQQGSGAKKHKENSN